MPTARICDVIVDCADPDLVAAFWAGLLGRAVAGRVGPYVTLVEEPGEVNLSFQHVEAPRRGVGRTHVDVSVPDVHEAAERVRSLGGRQASGYDEGGFLVMEDPEGNVFCLVPDAHFEIDDDGRADYLDGVGGDDQAGGGSQ